MLPMANGIGAFQLDKLIYWNNNFLFRNEFLILDAIQRGVRFVEEGAKELSKVRRVLCGSYVYGYYLEDDGHNKTIFEYMQVISLQESLILSYLKYITIYTNK